MPSRLKNIGSANSAKIRLTAVYCKNLELAKEYIVASFEFCNLDLLAANDMVAINAKAQTIAVVMP